MIWRTKHIYVDVETGEVLDKVEHGVYRVVKKEIKSSVYKSTGTRVITHKLKKDEQIRLFK